MIVSPSSLKRAKQPVRANYTSQIPIPASAVEPSVHRRDNPDSGKNREEEEKEEEEEDEEEGDLQLRSVG